MGKVYPKVGRIHINPHLGKFWVKFCPIFKECTDTDTAPNYHGNYVESSYSPPNTKNKEKGFKSNQPTLTLSKE